MENLGFLENLTGTLNFAQELAECPYENVADFIEKWEDSKNPIVEVMLAQVKATNTTLNYLDKCSQAELNIIAEPLLDAINEHTEQLKLVIKGLKETNVTL